MCNTYIPSMTRKVEKQTNINKFVVLALHKTRFKLSHTHGKYIRSIKQQTVHHIGWCDRAIMQTDADVKKKRKCIHDLNWSRYPADCE